jgi:hypothetical protein
VQWLLQRVDLSVCQHALKPFNGTGVISAALSAAGVSQVCREFGLWCGVVQELATGQALLLPFTVVPPVLITALG